MLIGTIGGSVTMTVESSTYVHITANQPHAKSNPNPTTKQRSAMNIQLNIVTCTRYHGVHVVSLFIRCVIMLTTLCCCQLPAMVCNSLLIFVMYNGSKWDLKFNPLKSQLITFGGQNPCCQIMLNGSQIPRLTK